MIPVVSARSEHHDLRPEGGGIVERPDIDADHVRDILRRVVERRAALAAKSLALGGAAVGAPQMFGDLARDLHGGTGKHHHGGVSRTGVALAIAALALKASNRLRLDAVAHRAAGAAARVSRHQKPPDAGRSPW